MEGKNRKEMNPYRIKMDARGLFDNAAGDVWYIMTTGAVPDDVRPENVRT